MYGLDNTSGVKTMPALAPVNSATPLWFTEGGAGLAASYPGQDWFNMIQAELLGILTTGGIKPEKGKLNQLSEAIKKIVNSAGYQPSGDYATKTELTNGLNTKLNITGGTVTRNGAAITLKNMTDGGNHYLQFQNVDGKRRAFIGFGSDTNKNFSIVNDEVGSNLTIKANGATINGLDILKVGDYGFGKSSSAYTPTDKISDYRINSISYAEGSKGDSFLGVNNHLLNVFGFTSSAYGYQVGFVGGQERVGFRAIINNVVKDWHEFYSTANTQADHNGNVKIPGYLERSDYPVGCPIPWPQSSAPAGYLICNGQAFNKTTYPLLAVAYPSGKLPDLRSEFIRGLDAGRNVDASRAVLSAQGDAIRDIEGGFTIDDQIPNSNYPPFGAFKVISGTTNYDASSDQSNKGRKLEFKASHSGVPTANENRPRNIAFLYIVRAA